MFRCISDCCSYISPCLFPSLSASSYKSFELPPTSLRDSILHPEFEKSAEEISTKSEITFTDLNFLEQPDQIKNNDKEMFSPVQTPLPDERQKNKLHDEEKMKKSLEDIRRNSEEKKPDVLEIAADLVMEDNIEKTQEMDEGKKQQILEWNVKWMKQQLINELMDENSLSKYDKIHDDLTGKSKLKVFWKSYLNQNFRINILRAEFELGCEPEFFIEFLNNFDLQLKLTEKNVEENRQLLEFSETNPENPSFSDKKILKTGLMYLKYKKVLTISSRDFIFIKHTELLDSSRSLFIDVGKTPTLPPDSQIENNFQSIFPLIIDNSLIPPAKEGVIRGDIILSGSTVEKIEGGCRVKIYNEMDMRQNLPQIVMKPAMLMELKKYVEKVVGICGAKN
jgi:hypothetical protein